MAASRILVGHDGSPHAKDALALGRVLSELTGAELMLARVVHWDPLALQAVPLPELPNRYQEQERNALAELQRIAEWAGAKAEPGPGESPAQGLQLLAEELNPDIVVVGSSHRGRISQVLAGNIALRLLNGLDRPLAVAPAGYAEVAGGLRTIGVGFDGSPESRAALRIAGELALSAQAELRVKASPCSIPSWLRILGPSGGARAGSRTSISSACAGSSSRPRAACRPMWRDPPSSRAAEQ
jgi:nucleotide-binding universal stress UspA family protein